MWFGHEGTPLVDELAALVLSGVKRGTAGLARYVDLGLEPEAKVGAYWILVDGNNAAKAVTQTTRVDIEPFAAVTEEFAWIEGEGDRSLRHWQTAHGAFFESEARMDGFIFHDQMPVILERFIVVFPPEFTDQRSPKP